MTQPVSGHYKKRSKIANLINTDQSVKEEGVGTRHDPRLNGILILWSGALTMFNEELERVLEAIEGAGHG